MRRIGHGLHWQGSDCIGMGRTGSDCIALDHFVLRKRFIWNKVLFLRPIVPSESFYRNQITNHA